MGSTPLNLNDQETVSLGRLFGLLAEPNRLRILLLLCDGEMNVSALCAALDIPQPTVSHHLALLRRSNLLEGRRSGKMIHYGLSDRVQCADRGELTIRSLPGFRVRIGRHGITPESNTDQSAGA